MFLHDGHAIGDAWYFVDALTDTVHMFYLAWPAEEDGSYSSFVGHAVSKDLSSWVRLEPVLHSGPLGSWDDLRICTGSTIERQGRYWMAYSATSTKESSTDTVWDQYRVQRSGMAVSDDLVGWTKLSDNPTSEPDFRYYEGLSSGLRNMAHWRDPYLYDSGERIYQLICARRLDGDVSRRGAVGLATSTDMHKWEVLPPLEHDSIADEMECPQIYQINGRWYLVFCTLGKFFSKDYASRFKSKMPERSNFAMVSDNPLGPYKIYGTGQIIVHSPESYFYAAQLVSLRGQWYLLATIHDEGQDRISDPVCVYADEMGIHQKL